MQIKTQSRVVMATLAAALTFTAVDMRPVAAAQAGPHRTDVAKTQASGATEFSSQHRHYRGGRYYGYRRGNAAAAAAIVGTFGAVAGIAAAQRYRDGYYDYGYSAPAYGYAESYAYAPTPYYGARGTYGRYGARNEYFPN